MSSRPVAENLSSAGRQVLGGDQSRPSTGGSQQYRTGSRASSRGTGLGEDTERRQDYTFNQSQGGASKKSARFGQDTYEQKPMQSSSAFESNPFALPSDEEVFKRREQEREQKQEERQKQQKLRIWEKGAPKREGMLRQIHEEAEPELDAATQEKIKRTQNLVSAATAAMASSKKNQSENMQNFVEKKREMFLLQMSLDTKREEIQKVSIDKQVI